MSGKQGYWVIRTYKAGHVGEKSKHFIEGTKPAKSLRRLKSDMRKLQQNEFSAVKTVARLFHANFHKGDILIGLDYLDEGMVRLMIRAESIRFARAKKRKTLDEPEAEKMECIRQAAQQEMVNYIRRVKASCERDGIEVKYVAITSDMDGKTGESVRVHHHMVISAAALPACLKKWGLGTVEYSPLSGQPDYTPIAEYFIRQVRHVPDAKKYTPSRNLIRPEPQDRIAVNASELRVPKGCALLHRNSWQPGMTQYIRYLLPPSPDMGDEDDKGNTYRQTD